MPAISLYVHIPFCLRRCLYCDFVSHTYRPETASIYLKALKKEVAGLSIREKVFATLYIGGGTPTALDREDITGIVEFILNHLPFVKDPEVTIEANPGTIDEDKLISLRKAGVNRISIGVQSFMDDELLTLGRIHTADDAQGSVFTARKAGFENIGIDMIYGIPGQDINAWKKSLEKAVGLCPTHISTYELTLETGTIITEDVKSGRLIMPDDESIVSMYEYAMDYLQDNGFRQYEISNFAVEGYECRHNLNYWQRGEYLGVGVGAHSFFEGRRSYNTKDLNRYILCIKEGESPVDGWEDIAVDRAFSETIFLGLRKTDGIKLDELKVLLDRDFEDVYAGDIEEMRAQGLIEIADGRLRLTRRGRILSNEVFIRFI